MMYLRWSYRYVYNYVLNSFNVEVNQVKDTDYSKPPIVTYPFTSETQWYIDMLESICKLATQAGSSRQNATHH